LFKHVITPFLIIGKIFLEKIRKKNKFKNQKKDQNLDQDNSPECAADGHSSEALIIKKKNAVYQGIFQFEPVNNSKDKKIFEWINILLTALRGLLNYF
jgi:hypothetical protein